MIIVRQFENKFFRLQSMETYTNRIIYAPKMSSEDKITVICNSLWVLQNVLYAHRHSALGIQFWICYLFSSKSSGFFHLITCYMLAYTKICVNILNVCTNSSQLLNKVIYWFRLVKKRRKKKLAEQFKLNYNRALKRLMMTETPINDSNESGEKKTYMWMEWFAIRKSRIANRRLRAFIKYKIINKKTFHRMLHSKYISFKLETVGIQHCVTQSVRIRQ